MDNIDDDIRNNVRKRLDITKATNYRLEWLVFSLNANIVSILRKGRNNSVVSIKQLSSQTGTSLPSNKQACLISSTKADSDVLSNRKYRRIILRNFKEFIYKTSFRTSLFAVLEGCIEGYKFLYTAGFFYKDISINNLIINKDDDNLYYWTNNIYLYTISSHFSRCYSRYTFIATDRTIVRSFYGSTNRIISI